MAQMLDLADLVGGESKAAIINTFKEPDESNIFFFFWPHHTTFGILVPNQGSSPCLLHWKNEVLTTGPPRKSQENNLNEGTAKESQERSGNYFFKEPNRNSRTK